MRITIESDRSGIRYPDNRVLAFIIDFVITTVHEVAGKGIEQMPKLKDLLLSDERGLCTGVLRHRSSQRIALDDDFI